MPNGQLNRAVSVEKAKSVYEAAYKESVEGIKSVSRMTMVNHETIMKKLQIKQFQDGCISAIQARGLQTENMENWPVDALAKYLAENGGLEIVQGLREEFGLKEIKGLEGEKATPEQPSRVNREDDDDFTL